MNWKVVPIRERTLTPRSVKVKGTKIKNHYYNRYHARHIQRIVRDQFFHYGRAHYAGYITYNGEEIMVFLHNATWKCEEMLDQDIMDERVRKGTHYLGRWVESYGR